MSINTGDYQVEFIDHKGEIIAGSMFQSAIYVDAVARAQAMKPMFGGCQWRIMKCMHNSTDIRKERWE